MSYYNYMYHPLKNASMMDLEEDDTMFNEKNTGFETLVKFIGEDFVSIINEKRTIVLKSVRGGSDYLRPRDLDWNWHEECFYGQANCFILVSDLFERVDWSKVNDIDEMEKTISLYQSKIKKFGNKLIILPE